MAGALLPWSAALWLVLLWRALGGHVALPETLTALAGHLLYAAFVTAVGIAAAAFTRSFAQAATAALVAVALTWAIDAAEGFSALAWLGGAAAWSPTTYLRPFEEGTLTVAPILWFLAATAAALSLAILGCRYDLRGPRRIAALAGCAFAGALACLGARHVSGARDLSESNRHSLPPAAARALRTLPGRLEIIANLDREDSRRHQLESDTLAKLRLARPDLRVRWPPDERSAPGAVEQGDGYGRITLRLGERSVDTTSTSRRELVTLIFQLAGRPLPDWSQPEYPGYPLIVEGARRSAVLVVCYAALPLSFLIIGAILTRTRRRSS